MTLAEMLDAFPDLFYLNNRGWFDGESFMSVEPRAYSPFFQTATARIDEPVFPVQAVDLAALYIKNPEQMVWRKFLYTDNFDRYGNRVYVGGIGQYGIDLFQIHRRIEPSIWWPYMA